MRKKETGVRVYNSQECLLSGQWHLFIYLFFKLQFPPSSFPKSQVLKADSSCQKLSKLSGPIMSASGATKPKSDPIYSMCIMLKGIEGFQWELNRKRLVSRCHILCVCLSFIYITSFKASHQSWEVRTFIPISKMKKLRPDEITDLLQLIQQNISEFQGIFSIIWSNDSLNIFPGSAASALPC